MSVIISVEMPVVVPALCLDLDGTIRYSKTGGFINDPDDVALFEGVGEKIWQYRNEGYLVIGISNQAGVAYGFKTVIQIEAELDATLALFVKNPFHIIKQCYHHPAGSVEPYRHRSLLRKSDTGMLALAEKDAFDDGYVIDWDKSLFVGDRSEDEVCAGRAGIKFIWADEFFERHKG